ncbi:InlB B-repeat-containing protein [Aeromicrobium sp.]|uniref:beta strand repeat-containing protein n=1 Tax=Aeromicrobium sp. TaxID=1871063 RepID=UPI0028AF3092|nr:InlB B-repeat-containing protein [Aeromicrobium sp.]
MRHVLVPAVVALVVGASVPAVADDTIDGPAVADPSATAPVEEPTTEPTSDPTEPSPEPSETPTGPAVDEPSDAPTVAPTTAATPKPTRTRRSAEQRAAAGAVTLVTTLSALRQALSSCAAGDVTRLGSNISVSNQVVMVGCDATLDLAGHQLNLEGILVNSGAQATIDDSVGGGRLHSTSRYGVAAISPSADAELTIAGGSITAAGAQSVAGITVPANATLNITGGTVTATGGSMSAGIGGNGWGDSGTIKISGGTVNATGGFQGAGIGGGYNRSQGPISITGGTVTATGRGGQFSTTDEGGAGIGPSDDGYSAGAILIGERATVTATGGPLASAIGYGGDGFDYGATTKARVTIDGTVRTSGILNTYNGVYTVGATGQVLGLDDDPQAGPVITGNGTIVNNGAIRPTSVASTAKVNNHHFTVSYNLAAGTAGPGGTPSVTIYAPTLRAAGLALPARPTRSGHVFDGWTRSGGSAFTLDTDLGNGSTNGNAVSAPVTAAWATTTSWLGRVFNCTDGRTVRLPEDMTASSVTAVASCDLTLDLNGHNLTVGSVTIAPGNTLTVDDGRTGGTLVARGGQAGIRTTDATLVIDGGTITATGSNFAAGIGGVSGEAGGTVTINGGTVTATGSNNAAGIGGGHLGGTGTVTISGGTVTARATGVSGAGIGSGWRGGIGSVHITGGSVTATGATAAPGIGSGGDAGLKTSVEITGGTVVAHGGAIVPGGDVDVPGIGPGPGGVGIDVVIGAGADVTVNADAQAPTALGSTDWRGLHGSVRIDGTVRLPSGTLGTTNNPITVGATGQVLGTTADPTTGARITGSGTIANGGLIALSDVAGTVGITGHHYAVTASTGSATVYGPSVRTGHRTMPADPTRGIDTFTGWTHDDDPFTAMTTLPGTSADGAAVPVDLSATWDEGAAAFDRAAISVTAGDPVATDLTLTDGDGDPVSVDPADWTITTPADVSLTHTNGAWGLSGTLAGTGTVTASTVAGGRTYTAELAVTVNAAAQSELVVASSGTPAQGETITLSAEGRDRFGNDLGDVTGDVIFTSSNPSDVIDGAEASFTQAGDRTFTATHADGSTGTLVVSVAVVLDPVLTMTLSSTGTAAQGGTIALSATGADRFDNDLGDVTGDVSFTSSNPSDIIDGANASFTQAGKRTFTATHANGTTATLEVDVAVALDEVAEMELTFTGTARQGESIELTVTGTDRFGNDLGDVTGDVTFTSSVSSDVVDGNRVTFPHASPHTITATHATGTTATLMVRVEAVSQTDETEAKLPAAGSTMSAWWLASGLALLLAGGAFVGRARRR